MSNAQAALLAAQLKQATDILLATMAEMPAEVMHADPGGVTATIAANVAHTITGIDGVIHGMVGGNAPLMMSEPTGLSAPAPQGSDWGDWGKTVQVDGKVFHEYAVKVIESAVEYVGTLNEEALGREIESDGGTKMNATQWLTVIILNTAWHNGEISAMKGISGLKGYPF